MSGLMFRKPEVLGRVESIFRVVEVPVQSVGELKPGDEVISSRLSDTRVPASATVKRLVELLPHEADLVRQGIDYGRSNSEW